MISYSNDLTFALLIFTTITLVILWYKSRKTTLPPGPRGLPLVGYLPFLDPNLHQEFTKLAQRYGPIFKLKLGSKTHIVVSSSDLAKVIVREQDEVFSNRDPLEAGLIATYGGLDIVLSNNNSYWRNMRKVLVSEALSHKNLEASRTFRLVEVRKTIKRVYETMDIVTAGTDTTSTSVEWTMTELLQNSKIIRKVQDELEQVVGLNNIVEESHLPKLKYLDAVIKESFRLHPPLPFLIVRSPNKSCVVGGYTVPKGSNVYLNVWSIHRDPQYWNNPLELILAGS